MKKVCIIGAGLSGSEAALFLARRGYDVYLYELRDHLEKPTSVSSRSINLAMSCRGLTSLKELNLDKKVSQYLVPMRARAIHNEGGEIHYQAFGRGPDEYIYAIQRYDLNKLLIKTCEKKKNIYIKYSKQLTEIDLDNKTLTFLDKETQTFDILIGADGANSIVRGLLHAQGRLQFTREFLPYGYKELTLVEEPGILKKEHLHLWPRASLLLLGNPNCNGSFTGTLFLPHRGKSSFESLNNKRTLLAYFRKMFPDITPHMKHLIEEFFDRPTGSLSTVRCSPWYYKDCCLLLGDAAHAVVPFFGQGMNAAFEDCRILNKLLDQCHDNWSLVLPKFYNERKPNTDAIAQMSLDNYHEIQHAVRKDRFKFKKRFELELMHRFPQLYTSKHVLVMFTNTPYLDAYTLGKRQEGFISELIKDTTDYKSIDWNLVKHKLEHTQPPLSIN